MSSPAWRPAPDARERAAAIDPRESFLVQAPAGSGKTELLIQRFLRLLAVVERPEAIVAITFTRKAAAEMIHRIVEALREARENSPVEKAHRQLTRALAEAALARDRELGWSLLEHPARLRVQTIDSLCMAIAAEMPWLTRLGGMPRIDENARELYREAARRTVLLAGHAEYGEPVSDLLRYLDNNAASTRDLVATMLGTREQWIALVAQTKEGGSRPLEAALLSLIESRCALAERLIPGPLRTTWLSLTRLAGKNVDTWPGADRDTWIALIELVQTNGGEWRKRLTNREGFPATDRARKEEAMRLIGELEQVPGLASALKAIRELPPGRFTDSQWEITLALLGTLNLAAAQLRGVFRENGSTDFVEIGMAARLGLGDSAAPSDLAFRLDARIEHLLVDEFQDTSRGQMDLIQRLTGDWQPGDGRTIFLVGDPMQSIYRFRQAEVGIFLETSRHGLGRLPLRRVSLVSNYRSSSAIVDRVNRIFEQLFPAGEDSETGAVPFQASQGLLAADGEVQVHGFAAEDDRGEAGKVTELILEARERAPSETIAVLVRARTHLPAIVETLKSARIPFRAVEIDPLAERTVVVDLLALTRAMLYRADRISWLAILRAPWCGVGLADLEKVSRGPGDIWASLQDISFLSEEGQQRVVRLRGVLSEAFEQQGRWPLRRWVERTWIQIGGPACLGGDDGALSDAAAYFDRLEAWQAGSELPYLGRFVDGLKDLFAPPDSHASDRLQVMTIHKAKGLEFDTVIVPGLGRPDRKDDPPLALFHDWSEANETRRLLAPIEEAGGASPLYEYLRKLDARKAAHERVRLLYVAATRARKSLHLLGQAQARKDGEAGAAPRSMLRDLLPALTPAELDSFARRPEASSQPASVPRAASGILPLSWTPPPLAANLAPGGPPQETHQPTFEWVGESLRIAGTLVHEMLRRVRDGEIAIPPAPVLRRLLLHAGVIPSEAGITLERVQGALSRIWESPRAKWILANHSAARSEYAIEGVDGEAVVRGKVDRTFLDENGVRWIVDFKTSVHSGGSLDAFLDEQQRRYRDQLGLYARLLGARGNPVRVGLYFPLLDEWREWSP